MNPPIPFHPLIVHLALSLGLLSAVVEILPSIKRRIPPWTQKKALELTLLFLFLALLTGILSFSTIKAQHIPVPLMASIHGGIALSGGVLFLLLWILTERGGERHPGTLPSRQLIAGAGLLALLVAATLGGQLVYKDRLGTSRMTDPPSLAPSPR